MRARFAVVLGVVALACAPVLAACGSDDADDAGTGAATTSGSSTSGPSGSSGELEPLKVLYTTGFTGHLPPVIVAEAGIFRRHGLDVSFTNSPEPLTPLLSGDVDVALPQPTLVAVSAAQGRPVKVISGVVDRIQQSLLLAPDVASEIGAEPGDYPAVVRALDGKRIGVTVRGGSVDLDMRYMLRDAGLTPDKDVRVIAAGGGGPMLAALRAGQVDGILGFPPLTETLLNAREAVSVLDIASGEGPELLQQPFVVAAALPELVEERPEVASAFAEGMQEGIEWMQDPANEAELTRIVREQLEGIDPALLPSIVEVVRDTASAAYTTDDMDKAIELMREVGGLEGDVDPAELVDTELVPSS